VVAVIWAWLDGLTNGQRLLVGDDCRNATEPAFSRDTERCQFCLDLKTADDLLAEIEWEA
jgi:hypothetical protein